MKGGTRLELDDYRALMTNINVGVFLTTRATCSGMWVHAVGNSGCKKCTQNE